MKKNRAAVLAFRSIGKGHSGAKKVGSILNNDKPINAHSWRSHTEAISECSEKIMDLNLRLEAHNAKSYLCKTGQLNITENEVNDHNVEIRASLTGLGIREAGHLGQALLTHVLSQLEKF